MSESGDALRIAGAMLIVLAVAVVLRVWGMDYGLPYLTARPDEERIVGRAFTILATKNFHPGDYTYPGLLKYLNTLALAAYVWVGKLQGHYGKLLDFQFEVAVTNPGLQYRICRSFSVLLGVATVGLTYLLARNAYRNRIVGLMAAAALATCYLHVRDSRFATVDVGMTFFVTLSILFAVRATEGYRTADFVLSGMFAGMAAATKYNAGMVTLGLAAACLPVLLGRSKPPEGPTRKAVLAKLLLAAVVSAGAFALTTPYTLVHYRAVLGEFSEIQKILYGGTGARALWIHLPVTFPEGLGWPLFLTSVAGVIRAAWLRRSADLVLLAFLVPFFGSAAGVRWVFPRYLVPLTPFLSVLAAEFTFFVLCRSRRAPAVLAALVLVAPGLWKSVAFDRVAARKDTRVLASDWVAENVPRRSVILVCRGYGAPAINADRRRPPAFEPRLVGCTPESVMESDAGYLITHQHPWLQSYSRISEEMRQYLSHKGRAVAVFDPFDKQSDATPYFYAGDAFYLPISGLEAMERGGPVITIWEINDSS